jgi:hypothetical protein
VTEDVPSACRIASGAIDIPVANRLDLAALGIPFIDLQRLEDDRLETVREATAPVFAREDSE